MPNLYWLFGFSRRPHGIGPQQLEDEAGMDLWEACRQGHAPTVQLLLSQGRDVNEFSPDGETPLYLACKNSRAGVVEILLDAHGLDVNLKMPTIHTTAFWEACSAGPIEVVRKFLQRPYLGTDINEPRTFDGATPLYVACSGGHTAVVELLLAQPGIDVHKEIVGGSTTLHLAAAKGNDVIAGALLKLGANATSPDADGMTPFMVACRHGHPETAGLMTTIGIGGYGDVAPASLFQEIVLATDNLGNTAAFHAAECGNINVLKFLREGAAIRTDILGVQELYPADRVFEETDLPRLQLVRDALIDRAYNSYQMLPEYRRVNGQGLDRSASAYLLAASLLATVTSLGFLTPPGGYEAGILGAKSGAFAVLVVFLFFNALCFFTALATALLCIKVLAPANHSSSTDPLKALKRAKLNLTIAAAVLILAVASAALAFAAAIVYPIFPHSKEGSKAGSSEEYGRSDVGIAVVCGMLVVPFLSIFATAAALFVVGPCMRSRERQRISL